MQFGLFGSASARRASGEFDSTEGYHDFIEYNVEADVDSLSYTAARWLAGPPEKVNAMQSGAGTRLVNDRHGRPVEEVAPAFSWWKELPFVEGALAHVGCRVEAIHEAGDHRLWRSGRCQPARSLARAAAP